METLCNFLEEMYHSTKTDQATKIEIKKLLLEQPDYYACYDCGTPMRSKEMYKKNDKNYCEGCYEAD